MVSCFTLLFRSSSANGLLFSVNAMYVLRSLTLESCLYLYSGILVNMSSYPGQKTQLNVRLLLPSRRSWVADGILDINSELDELDREEFYRLKKVCIEILNIETINTKREGTGFKQETARYSCGRCRDTGPKRASGKGRSRCCGHRFGTIRYIGTGRG